MKKNTISTDEILRKAISVYGEKAQLLMLIEEMDELWDALTNCNEQKEQSQSSQEYAIKLGLSCAEHQEVANAPLIPYGILPGGS